jgi:hypothetical protein
MLEAIFNAAPSDPAAAMAYIAQWQDILNAVLPDLQRGGDSSGIAFADGTVWDQTDIARAVGATSQPAERHADRHPERLRQSSWNLLLFSPSCRFRLQLLDETA